MIKSREPDIVVSAIFMRLFYKKLEHGRYVAPSFLFPTAEYWSNSMPKFVYGKRKIVTTLPLECDASILVQRGPEVHTISMKEMILDVRKIPFEMLQSRSEIFKSSWEHVLLYTDAEKKQAGITEAEFNYLYTAFGPGAWCSEVLIKE